MMVLRTSLAGLARQLGPQDDWVFRYFARKRERSESAKNDRKGRDREGSAALVLFGPVPFAFSLLSRFRVKSFPKTKCRWAGMSAVMLALTACISVAAPAGGEDPHHQHSHGSPSKVGGGGAAPGPSERQAMLALAQKGIMPNPGRGLRPNQPVTRGELAVVLVRMIDYLENAGPKKVSKVRSPALVTSQVRAGLAALPRNHPAYRAISHLALGGYLLASNRGELFMPTRQNIDRPVTAAEFSAAVAGVASRITEKRTALEHPAVVGEQRDTVTAPGQHRGTNTPPP
jgi:hypothetical protein